MGAGFCQHIIVYIGRKKRWRLCLCLLGNILLDVIILRRKYSPGLWCPVGLLCLLGMLRWDSGGWILVWRGLDKGQYLCTHRPQVVFLDKIWCIPWCCICYLCPPLLQIFSPQSGLIAPHFTLKWAVRCTIVILSVLVQRRFYGNVLDPWFLGGQWGCTTRCRSLPTTSMMCGIKWEWNCRSLWQPLCVQHLTQIMLHSG